MITVQRESAREGQDRLAIGGAVAWDLAAPPAQQQLVDLVTKLDEFGRRQPEPVVGY